MQTADILAPIVNDAESFGRIAAANALSDVYAMGGQPWCAMCLGFFPACMAASDDKETLISILNGALEKMREAGAVLAGGHTVQDDELKFGLSVTGIIDPQKIARNDGLEEGQYLILTKPLGVGILATAIKAHWDYAKESEAELNFWCAKLNDTAGALIPTLNLHAATDITGFGLGGHALEMARASRLSVQLFASKLPLLPHTLNYALDGLIPAGTHANQEFFQPFTLCLEDIEPALLSIIFDAQTSGGLLLAINEEQLTEAINMLLAGGNLATVVGQVQKMRKDGKFLVIGN